MALTNALSAHAGKSASTPLIALALSVTFDSSYPTGGEAFDAEALLQSLGSYDKAPTVLAVVAQTTAGFVFEYDAAAKTLIAYEQTNVATSPLIEFPNGTDLASELGGPVPVVIFAV